MAVRMPKEFDCRRWPTLVVPLDAGEEGILSTSDISWRQLPLGKVSTPCASCFVSLSWKLCLADAARIGNALWNKRINLSSELHGIEPCSPTTSKISASSSTMMILVFFDTAVIAFKDEWELKEKSHSPLNDFHIKLKIQGFSTRAAVESHAFSGQRNERSPT